MAIYSCICKGTVSVKFVATVPSTPAYDGATFMTTCIVSTAAVHCSLERTANAAAT